MVTAAPVAEDLRAEVARKRVAVYKLAAKVGIHPGRLGMMLNGTVPLPPDVARSVKDAIEEINAESQR